MTPWQPDRDRAEDDPENLVVVASGDPLAPGGSISLSMGHDIRTMLRHYAGLGWPPEVQQEIRQYTAGWGDE